MGSGGSSGCAGGLRCWSICQLKFLNTSRNGVLAVWYCVSRLVDARWTCGGFFFREIPFVFGWSWVLRLAQAHSCVCPVKSFLQCDVKSDELCGVCPTEDVDTPNLEPHAATRKKKITFCFSCCDMMCESLIGADLGRGCGMKGMCIAAIVSRCNSETRVDIERSFGTASPASLVRIRCAEGSSSA